MKAWLATDIIGLGAGLGKMDILVVPRENGNSLAVHFTTDDRIWIEEEEMEGQPDPKGPLKKIEIPEELVKEIEFSFNMNKGNFTPHTRNLLSEFVKDIKSKQRKKRK